MKLFYAPQSPFSRKVRVAAIELGLTDSIELTYAEVLPGKPNNDYAATISPLRQIPVLQLDGGTTIFDSDVNCSFINDFAGGSLIPPAPLLWHVLTRNAVAQGMCDALITIRYETGLRPFELRWEMWTEDFWSKFFDGLAWFENRFDELDGPLDISQISLGCALGYLGFRYPSKMWKTDFPRLAAWAAKLNARYSFQATQPMDPPSRQ